mgnify:CR=1 FL=1|tara:strand:- start:920 stop:1300 length:381 start_codon:yes stop_codon:yes gene_type:complete
MDIAVSVVVFTRAWTKICGRWLNELPDKVQTDSAIQGGIPIPHVLSSRNPYTVPFGGSIDGGAEVMETVQCCLRRIPRTHIFYGRSIQTGIDKSWCFDCAAPCGYQNGDHWEEDGYADENARWVIE